jgi:glycosyltransferase involved in cell wall biosynthesis
MFFSIVIPTYNRSAIIKETTLLLQNQTFIIWECIVVDDGSTDDTKSVISEISKTDDRIRYVYQENAERSVARNNGFSQSKGEYVIFLDSDDGFASNYLQELHGFLQSKSFPKALVVSNYCSWDGETTNEVMIPSLSKNSAEWLFDYPVSPSRACVHREILHDFQFREDIVIVEDTVLWVSMMNKYPLLHFTPHLVWYIMQGIR